MWNRKELKANAKKVFHAHYWKAVLAALLMLLILGTYGGGNGGNGGSYESAKNNIKNLTKVSASGKTFDEAKDDLLDEIKWEGEFLSDEDKAKVNNAIDETIAELEEHSQEIGLIFIPVAIVSVFIIFIISVFVYVVKAFALNIFEIGGRKYFVNNHDNQASFKDFLYGFKRGYWKSVLTMFLRDLFTTLWTMLFIIPGIVKAYEYKMIPYLLAENPGMERREAFAKSKEMMKGNKWAAFVLDLSFLGWCLLNVLTFGTLGIFHVNPYMYQTDAELYIALRDYSIQNGTPELAADYTNYIEAE